jgi:hypothetical protein
MVRAPLFRFGNRLADFTHPFPFRLLPIFEVVTNQPAPGAMDLVSAVQDFFYTEAFADCIFAEDFVFKFNSICDFAMQMYDDVPPFARSSATLPSRRVAAKDFVEGSGQRLRVRGRWPQSRWCIC